MKFKIALVGLAIASSSLADTPPGEIYGFKQGLVNAEQGIVYTEGAEFPYQENAICNKAGASVPCMNIGFSFRWSGVRPGSELICLVRTDRPAKAFNSNFSSPNEQLINHEVKLTFSKPSGHQLLPISLQKDEGDSGTYLQTAMCTLLGREVINFKVAVTLGQ